MIRRKAYWPVSLAVVLVFNMSFLGSAATAHADQISLIKPLFLDPTPPIPDFLLTSNNQLQTGTVLQPIWMSASQLGKRWEPLMSAVRLDKPTRQVLFSSSKNNPFIFYDAQQTAAAANELGGPVILVVAALMPNGDLIISDVVKGNAVAFDTTRQPILRMGAKTAKYKLKVTYEDFHGNRRPAPEAYIWITPQEMADVAGYYKQGVVVEDEMAGKILAVNNGVISNPGPLPLAAEVGMTLMGTDPKDDLDDYDIIDNVILPAEPNGTFEFVLWDPESDFELAYENASDEEYEAAYDKIDWDAVDLGFKEVIYTPDNGVPGDIALPGLPLVQPSPLSGHVRLNSTSAPTTANKTKYGTRVATFGIDNIAGSIENLAGAQSGSVLVNSLTLTLSTKNASMIPPLTLRTMNTVKNKNVFSGPARCIVLPNDDSSCRATFQLGLKIAPGKTKSFGIVVDTKELFFNQSLDMKIAAPKDFTYTYIRKISKTKSVKTAYQLNAQQIPFIFQSTIRK